MSNYLDDEHESAAAKLIGRAELDALVDKLDHQAPAAAAMMRLMTTISDEITTERLDQLADEGWDLSRPVATIYYALLYDTYRHLGAITNGVEGWVQDEQRQPADRAWADLILALGDIVRDMRPVSGQRR